MPFRVIHLLVVCWLNCCPGGHCDLSVCVHYPCLPSSAKVIGVAKLGFFYLLWGSELRSSHPPSHLPSLFILSQGRITPGRL